MSRLVDFRGKEEILKKSFSNGLSQTLGIEFVAAYADGIEVQVEVSEAHARPGGIANGGLALALLETVGSISAYGQIDPKEFGAMGTSVTMNHIKPIKVGETIKARSKALHIGRSTQIWDVEIKNGSDQITSTGRITMLVLPNRA